MKSPLISVIIPCYNSFGDMVKCLDALENQTFKDFEVIIVNDCSKDDSASRLLEYAEKSQLRMRVISNETNRGPGYSRNVGIQAAEGEWLSFCDADDWYSYDRFEKMLSETDDETDCVLCNLKKSYLNGGESFIDYISNIPDINKRGDVVAKCAMSFDLCLIRSSIPKKIPIAELYNGEDYATLPLWLQYSRRIAFAKDGLYTYFMRAGSLSRKPSSTAYINFKKAFDYIRSKSLEEYREAVEYLGIYNILYGGVLSALKAGIKKKEIKSYIEEFVSEYPKWDENQYLKTLSKFKKLFLVNVRRKNFILLRFMAFVHKTVIKFR